MGCDTQQEDLSSMTDSVQKGLEDSINAAVTKAKSTIDALEPHQRAQDEINKFSAFEYHVESVVLPTNAQDLQIRLNDLGSERWECGSPVVGLTEIIEPTSETKALVVCKRRPESYLRMLKNVTP